MFGVRKVGFLRVEDYLDGEGSKGLFYYFVRAVPFSGARQRTVQENLKGVGFRMALQKDAARRSGPIVCELDGPRPVLYIDFIDVMPPDRFLSSGLMFASFMIASQVECLGFYRGILLGGIGGVPPAEPKKLFFCRNYHMRP